MAIPDAKLTIRDGALGITPTNAINVPALVGTASAGPLNTVLAFSDIQGAKDVLVSGPLLELAAHVLSVAGGPVVCVRSDASIAGSSTGVTKVGTGTSVGSLTGTPLDTYLAQLLVTTAATGPTAGTATFKYSLDGGRSFTEDISLPVSGAYLVPGTGVTITFAAGTLVVGDTYSWTSTGPGYNTTDANTAIQALLDDATTTWFGVALSGTPADDTAAGAIFGALDTQLSSAQANYRYARGFMQAQDDTPANVKTAWASRASLRVEPAYGFAYVTSPLSGVAYKRPAAWVAIARASAVAPSEDLGRLKSGSLVGVQALIYDEFKTPLMDSARFTTLRTFVGKQGYYITNGRLFAPNGSDFTYLQNGRVMDIGSTTVRAGMLNYLNDSIQVDVATGHIFEKDAIAIETDLESQLRAALTQPGYARDVSVTVDRTINILSTSKLVVRFRVLPLAYAKYIEGEIGFINPALQAAAA